MVPIMLKVDTTQCHKGTVGATGKIGGETITVEGITRVTKVKEASMGTRITTPEEACKIATTDSISHTSRPNKRVSRKKSRAPMVARKKLNLTIRRVSRTIWKR